MIFIRMTRFFCIHFHKLKHKPRHSRVLLWASTLVGNLFLRNATKKVPDENIGDFECRIAKT
ncbi:hypothetical protein [Vibrio breoganii]|uniref:hypothetical protein n=1 Tax=Vibrio breoganii TaxID=553239 RepID=UPI001F53D353|nr:hypothetical protein [Vibrio breoganii]